MNSIQWRRKLGKVLADLDSLTSRVESATLVEGVLAIMSSKGLFSKSRKGLLGSIEQHLHLLTTRLL